jgi:hypothetical protein
MGQNLVSRYLAMSARRRTQQQQKPERIVEAPTLDTCSFPVENISPEFDPNRVLLRRVFFISEDKSRYVSVGLYPTQNYQPFIEFGGNRNKPIALTQEHVSTFASHLPRLCQEVCADNRYQIKNGSFKVTTIVGSRAAKLTLDNQHLTLRLQDLQYLLGMFHVVQSQLNTYLLALPDILSYITEAWHSSAYVEPTSSFTGVINFPQLYEELTNVI